MPFAPRPLALIAAAAAVAIIAAPAVASTKSTVRATGVKPAILRMASMRQNLLGRARTDVSQLRFATIGSSQPVTAEPPVSRPNETPCVVTLFTPATVSFSNNFAVNPFAYAPPAACPGPWLKVVLDVDFNVTAGTQFDRTGNIYINGANFWFGTTAEPGSNLSPSWHVERDVTDLSAALAQPSTGGVYLGNVVNSQFNGVITATAKLEFFPRRGARSMGNSVADVVIPMSGAPSTALPQGGGSVYLFGPTVTGQAHSNTITVSLPRNIEQAYLDVFLQSQIGDEFWWSCFPDDLGAATGNCGGTAFREGEITIDGMPAGVAPVFPWIFTGGIDPFLWFPIPSVETYDFKPYRVNLTPFAALLSNGHQHTISITMFNSNDLNADNSFFATTASLLLFLDHGSSQVTGSLLRDGIAASPHQHVVENVSGTSTLTGTVDVTATHNVSLDGFVNTSHGRVETEVQQQISFANRQFITVSSSQFLQDIRQDTQISSTVTTLTAHASPHSVTEAQDWKLVAPINLFVNADGNLEQITGIHEQKLVGGAPPFRFLVTNRADATDTLVVTSTSFGPNNPTGGQRYTSMGQGPCYSDVLKAFNNVLTSAVLGCP